MTCKDAYAYSGAHQPHKLVDWSKVNTLDDIKQLLEATQMGFDPGYAEAVGIGHLLKGEIITPPPEVRHDAQNHLLG